MSSECLFLPNKPEKNGYVRLGREHVFAHRKAYEEAWGPIPEGWTVDHECHNADPDCPGGACEHRACVNPEHLSAKPNRANLLASDLTLASQNAVKEQCSNGHLYTPLNTFLWKGMRQCRMCKLLDHQRRHAEKKVIEWGLADVGEL